MGKWVHGYMVEQVGGQVGNWPWAPLGVPNKVLEPLMSHGGHGAMAARLTPDQKVGRSSRSGLIRLLALSWAFPNFGAPAKWPDLAIRARAARAQGGKGLGGVGVGNFWDFSGNCPPRGTPKTG